MIEDTDSPWPEKLNGSQVNRHTLNERTDKNPSLLLLPHFCAYHATLSLAEK